MLLSEAKELGGHPGLTQAHLIGLHVLLFQPQIRTYHMSLPSFFFFFFFTENFNDSDLEGQARWMALIRWWKLSSK